MKVICDKALELNCKGYQADMWIFVGCRHACPHEPFIGCGCFCAKYGGFQKDVPTEPTGGKEAGK